MRKIKGSITGKNSYAGKYQSDIKKGQYQQMKKMRDDRADRIARRVKAGIAAGVLAAGIGIGAAGKSAFENLADNFNYEKDMQEAIEIARDTDRYLNNQMLQDVINQEYVQQIEELSSAITDYKELRYKNDRSFKEEKQYIEACGVISEAREFVMNLYINEIREKVAEAYKITDEAEIANIEINDYITDNNQKAEHNPQIVLPNGTLIEESGLFSKNNGMDENLANNIKYAMSLRGAGRFSENKRIDDLPLDDIINTFEKAMEFGTSYTLKVNKKGNIETIKTEEKTETMKKGQTTANASRDNEER